MAANATASSSIVIDRKKVLGTGAYGIVYEGTWRGNKVAVKRIQNEYVQNNREKEALQTLDHPNVVKLHHFEIDSDFRYYALEFCQASLDQKFLDETNPKKYCGPMPPEKEVFLQLAKGLAYIHGKRLIHRDIKPHNVLIWVDPRQEKVVMKWADFGLSKKVNERGTCSTSAGIKGTYNWFPPEILKIAMEENNRKTTSPRGTVKSDVFSAGLVFGYYLLGGDHPFGPLINVPPNILKNEPVNLTKIKKHPMHAIILDMLKANPDERITSADVVLSVIMAANLTNSTENDVKWNELLTPAPMSIAVMSQLLIFGSRVTDFSIDFSDKEPIHLIINPDSFRKTLVQIANDADNAFMKAHINMEIIQLQTAQVPDYIRDCIKYMKSGNKSDIENLLPKRLEQIKEVATGGQTLSKEVCDTFHLLGQLIRQVITASVKTMGNHEIKIAAMIGEKTKDIRFGQKKMGIDVNNDISLKQAIETLRQGLGYLVELQKQWAGITLYFDQIRKHLKKTTAKNLEDFIDYVDVAQEGTEEYDMVMPDSIKDSLQSSYKTHHSAKIYVKVSNNYIVKSLTTMHEMIALPSSEVAAYQNKLIASCKEASKGIKDMYTEDNNNTIREIEVLANPQNS